MTLGHPQAEVLRPPQIHRVVLFLHTGGRPYRAVMAAPLRYDVLLADGLVEIAGANAYGPDGQMTTFYRCRDDRETIDAWSTRVASFRTADIRSVLRVEATAHVRVA